MSEQTEMLRDLLNLAESGELTTFCFAGVNKKGQAFRGMTGVQPELGAQLLAQIGMLEILKDEIKAHCKTM